MKVYAIQRADGMYLGRRSRTKGTGQRVWSQDAPELWNRKQAAQSAGMSVFGKYKIVSFWLTMTEENE